MHGVRFCFTARSLKRELEPLSEAALDPPDGDPM